MRQSAFSLIELSIVLVILGLLVGGILAGQSLIEAASLRAIGTEAEKYGIAINSFRVKYNALPGDFADAEKYWGSDTSCPWVVSTTPKTATCNGGGDGKIERRGDYRYYEVYRVWQHLANAD